MFLGRNEFYYIKKFVVFNYNKEAERSKRHFGKLKVVCQKPVVGVHFYDLGWSSATTGKLAPNITLFFFQTVSVQVVRVIRI